MLLKVSKSRKQFLVFSILPKNERKVSKRSLFLPLIFAPHVHSCDRSAYLIMANKTLPSLIFIPWLLFSLFQMARSKRWRLSHIGRRGWSWRPRPGRYPGLGTQALKPVNLQQRLLSFIGFSPFVWKLRSSIYELTFL